ncbi:flagellar biosynthesis anti-sigma factor FlgM [Clostridium algidicarnis]|uniref:flagellar biosynthesis anti-sigma factor FlgM n=1 Tax=Clostridium algidicarnis TaxID=37659 RepID=UPI001C0D59AD|nr:flagellar biosynthesis anti-sigma factor FlgM [Clostridium algidicarnis]MBU3202942.1 flagellar biosynthesis anti-sigma factor FlgM [Clostridium algidicarnis]MBU3211096.1 flagellar biosynthesis anti-sigma factor FlgM [Clostridium algidicarnis]MBU3222396.1 flagellar biosynthesis anti-sigma factor FlgM [Clostridium algidicarnis]
MNIKPVNHNVNFIKAYGENKKVNESNKSISKKDSIEISSTARSLSDMSIDNIDMIKDEKKVESIKLSVENGTYKVNSKDLADKMLKIMKGREFL